MFDVPASRFASGERALPGLAREEAARIHPVAIAGLMLAAALLVRWPHFGDPAFMTDEQFYLLVGDRMLHGALPFVDIWDRKPIGLFLIYAAIRLLGGDGIVQYQVTATIFAAATAFVMVRIACRAARPAGAIAAGLLYLLWLEVAEGGGGQAPVFYNLFVAGAALCTLRAAGAAGNREFAREATLAMALAGIALQIKYTAVFEALFFGLVLAALAWRRAPATLQAARMIAGLAAMALAPTALAMLWFWAVGAGGIFWFANFTSIFLRGPGQAAQSAFRLQVALVRLAPLFLCALGSAWHVRGQSNSQSLRVGLFVAGWMVAALAGFAAIGTFYSHYLLPVLVPFLIAAAPLLGRPAIGPTVALMLGLLAFATLGYPDVARTRRHVGEIAALTQLIPADVDRGCLLVFDGPPVLYRTSHACLPTRFAFPDHLSAANEERALGVDSHAELRRVLARRPRAIVLSPTLIRVPNRGAGQQLPARRQRTVRRPPDRGVCDALSSAERQQRGDDPSVLATQHAPGTGGSATVHRLDADAARLDRGGKRGRRAAHRGAGAEQEEFRARLDRDQLRQRVHIQCVERRRLPVARAIRHQEHAAGMDGIADAKAGAREAGDERPGRRRIALEQGHQPRPSFPGVRPRRSALARGPFCSLAGGRGLRPSAISSEDET